MRGNVSLGIDIRSVIDNVIETEGGLMMLNLSIPPMSVLPALKGLGVDGVLLLGQAVPQSLGKANVQD